ncbi:bile acid:sodium symporter family protein [Pseudoalteromonas aurantia]|uniref:Bile acid:Na+ symporter, BASS family n=1 Tax=Pseudoalteromonas aurantia 208 TaxID=1314867 RepID=A0ABR9EBC2_9GAMM|nr:bile acid:sodium symporter family protein [Pseudoalteromonas aurantia]MBE0368122.1 bile acid:Na+ symporter, BASS family [Pseudoalteromonas aurantia 208]
MLNTLISIALPIALIIIMIGVGLSLTADDFKRVFKQPKSFLLGAFCQLLVLPCTALCIILITGMKGELAAGLFILSLCPGGTTSNLFSYLAKADVGLSVSLTAVIGFITPFTIPLLSIWAINTYVGTNSSFSLPLFETWLKLMIITVIPVVFGMTLRKKWPTTATSAQAYVSWLSMTILALVIISICVTLDNKIVEYILLAGPAAIALNISTMLIGFLVAHYFLHNAAQSRTITLEVGLQNGTLALLITTGMLNNPVMSIAPSIYSLIMFFTASLFTFTVLRIQPSQAIINNN